MQTTKTSNEQPAQSKRQNVVITEKMLKEFWKYDLNPITGLTNEPTKKDNNRSYGHLQISSYGIVK